MPRCRKPSNQTSQQHRTMLLLRRFGSALFDGHPEHSQDEGQLFACPVCREVLDSPVTVHCGHTYCARCLDKLCTETASMPGGCSGEDRKRTRCVECHLFFNNYPRPATNVLVQEIVDKWRSSQRDLDGAGGKSRPVPDTSDILGLEPRYWLRTRHAGLQPLPGHDENHIYKIIRKLMVAGRGGRRKRACAGLTDDLGRMRRSWSRDTAASDTSTCGSEERALLLRILKSVRDVRDRALRTSWLTTPTTPTNNPPTTSDLDCILCSRCLHEPITTRCGHTFCRECLARVLDHGRACPLCMRTLGDGDAEEDEEEDEVVVRGKGVDDAVAGRGVTAVLARAVKVLAPREYRRRVADWRREIRAMDDDEQVPVFVCTNAFPGVACPLFVYVPRYRLLARRCLQSRGRRFAMAARVPPTAAATAGGGGGHLPQQPFAAYGTLLEVRDAVYLRDGRAILTTVGVRRFRVLEKGEQDGYDTARVQYIRDCAVPADRLPDLCALHTRVHAQARRWVASLAARLRTEVEACIGRMPALEPHWHRLADGPAWAWWLMPILPLSTQLQVGFLSTTSLEKRLRAIEKMLHHMKYVKYLERKALKFTDTDETADSCRLSWMI